MSTNLLLDRHIDHSMTEYKAGAKRVWIEVVEMPLARRSKKFLIDLTTPPEGLNFQAWKG